MHTEKCKRILIIKLSSIGDVVMATPVAKALRNAYPDAHISWVVEEKSKDVLIGNPYLDDIIILQRNWATSAGLVEVYGTVSGIIKSFPSIRDSKFDTVIDLQGLLRSALVGVVSGAENRLGFDSAGEGAALFYNKKLKTPGNKVRGPQDYLNMLQLLDVVSDDIDMYVHVSDTDRNYANDLISGFLCKSSRPVAALCPSTTWPQKHWTESGWAKLADVLAEDYGMLPVFLGSKDDIPLIDRIRGMMSAEAASAAGKTTLNQATALLSRSDLVVSVDTGLLHMAVGLDRPTVGIFGPTGWSHLAKKPSFTVVAKECPHMPCLRHPVCKSYDCMLAISHEDIISAAKPWLPENKGRSGGCKSGGTAASLINEGAGDIKKMSRRRGGSRPLKTVHIETGMHSLGGPAQVVYLLKGLKERGHDVTLVCPKGSGISNQALSADINVRTIPLKTDLDISFITKLYSILKDEKPDIVHLHSRRGADVLGGIAARLASVPGIILSRRIDNPVHPGIFSRFKYCTLCDRIVAISDGVYNALVKGGVEKKKIVRVHSAVDADAYLVERKQGLREELGIPEGSLVIGIVAQLIERKGHRFLLEVMPDILEKFPRTIVLILGEGHLDTKIRELVKSLGIEKNVIFAGFRNDIPYVLKEMDMLVHPATMEGLGVAILQAMASSLPVIASGVGGIPEAVRDGENGILVPPADSSAIKNAVIKLLADSDLRRKMGQNGRKIVEEEFSVNCMVEGILDVYSEILGAREK